jgi:tryptophan synthase alpha subunit
MDRISDIFASKKPLVVFTTAGYPDPARSEEGIASAIENGADII